MIVGHSNGWRVVVLAMRDRRGLAQGNSHMRHLIGAAVIAASTTFVLPAIAQTSTATTGSAQTVVSPTSLTSTQVQEIQQKLKSAGVYNGTVSGTWNTETQQAIQAYQKKNSLPATGTLDKETLAELGITSGGAGGSVGTAGQPATGSR